MFLEVPVLTKKKTKDGSDVVEQYLINTNNINYLRRWVGHKGYMQTVVYFNSTEKYIIVDMERDALVGKMLANKSNSSM